MYAAVRANNHVQLISGHYVGVEMLSEARVIIETKNTSARYTASFYRYSEKIDAFVEAASPSLKDAPLNRTVHHGESRGIMMIEI